ncbi:MULTISPECIES: response regulator [Rhizobium]|uniref:Response regulator with CheY-like receiver, AAA-type ATPase, and DNA-binding domains n=1 Tax=Rhizobium favelukesii TaxID=348824 RepID=W6S5P7_9HYPH|nr:MULTISPECIES: response regulator [Rhizobium]MCA0804754.1 response regulator [Rhizobium sp. T1473]MCS0458028.1 response regulator [Rhizobium favelukesii]UFS79866.1 response regulator [Rhizobium sp. T136]CDM61576.1 response regulator with CheY-like receiver, AAA-type ATPase, and DNA-binding domains [Rhizobium favelukesii]
MASDVETKRPTYGVARQSVLIVEDEFLIALDLESTIKDMGLNVAGVARDKEQALTLAPLADIAFVDVNLADGATGPEIGQRLVEEFGVTVVFMTGNPEAVVGRVEGALDILSKPATPSIVQTSLRHALDVRRSG